MKKLLFFIAFAISCILNAQQSFEPNWESIASREIPAWYTQAKFGIFIHWGVYSVPAWAPADSAAGKNFGQKLYGDKTYQEFAPEFKAEYFNPDQWAEIIK